MTKNFLQNLFFTVFLVWVHGIAVAQTWEITGRVTDAFTKEPLQFVYISATGDTCFAFSDSKGRYKITVTSKSGELRAVNKGYLPVTIPIKSHNKLVINFEMNASAVKMASEAHSEGNRAVEDYVSKIYENRDINNPIFNDYYSYRSYEKMQFDLNDITEELKEKKILRPFEKLLVYADTVESNESPVLPFFFTESVSDVYHRSKPLQKCEIVRANRSAGVENLTVIQLLRDIYRNIAVYDDYVNVFGKSFISPVSKEGMKHYYYYITDSTFIEGRKCYKVDFIAKKKHELTFSGNIWFNDTTFALQRITLYLGRNARLNFVDEFAYVKVFKTIDNGKWVPSHEQLIVRFSTRQKGMSITARKTKYYHNQEINVFKHDSVFKSHSYIKFDTEAFDRSREYWRKTRLEDLTEREADIFELVDTLKEMPAFQIYVATIVVALTGHVEIGKFDVGPYYHLVSKNDVEGYRMRFGGRTNDKFSQRWRFEGYGAYGTKDKTFKYMAGIRYTILKKPFHAIGYQFKDDVVQPGLHEPYFKDEGFITILFRRNPSNKLASVIANKFYYDASFKFGLSMRLQYLYNFYKPRSISFPYYTDDSFDNIKQSLRVSELWINFRYSYQEKFIEKKTRRVSMGSDYPVLHINAIKGLKNFMDGEFNYFKIAGRITHKLNVFPYGHINYGIEAGKVFGAAPYPLLYVQRGNESKVYDYTAFNLMNHYEFITDQYAGAAGVLHLNGYLWRHLPLLRKLDWRELVSARVLFGGLSNENKNFSAELPYPATMKTLPYVEVGTGLENIFKLFRVDALWRLTYRDNPGISTFGIRLSAQLLF